MKEIYYDENTNLNYTFDQDKLATSYENYIVSNKKLTKSALNIKLSEKVHVGEEAVRKHVEKHSCPNSIEIIYGYGDFLEGNRYAFLTLRESEDTFNEKFQEILSKRDFAENCIQAVRSGAISILSEYAASQAFNKKENSEFKDYRKKVDKLEIIIMQIHKNQELVNSLLNITTLLKKFICLNEYPGVTSEWYTINPKLRFYSPSFDLMINQPTAFEIAQTKGFLDYFPTATEKLACMEYFSRLDKENKEGNYHYCLSDFFQRELIKTMTILFDKLEY